MADAVMIQAGQIAKILSCAARSILPAKGAVVKGSQDITGPFSIYGMPC